jgi:hypothetical protein
MQARGFDIPVNAKGRVYKIKITRSYSLVLFCPNDDLPPLRMFQSDIGSILSKKPIQL